LTVLRCRVGYLVELDDPLDELDDPLDELDDELDELDDELDDPRDDEPFDELCDEFEVEVVPVVPTGGMASPVAGVLSPFVGGDGFAVEPVEPVSVGEPVEALVDPIGPRIGRVTGGFDGLEVVWVDGGDVLVLVVDVLGSAAGASLFVVGALVLVEVLELTADALVVVAGAKKCAAGDVVDAKGAGATPGGPGGSTGGPPTP